MASSKKTPLGYIAATDPQSTRQAFENWQVADRSVSIAKSAIHKYIQSFLSPTGVNRQFITASTSPVGVQFVTELSYDEEMRTNPNQRKTYLARFFAENTGRLPSILIIDNGVEYQDQGLNELISTAVVGSEWRGELLYFIKINISIMVATMSEEDTATLSSLILMILGPLSNALNNYLLHEYGSRWEIRLPIAAINIGQASSMTVEGDNKTTIWTRSVDLPIDFESAVSLSQPLDSYDIQSRVNVADVPMPMFFNLKANDSVPLGTQLPLIIQYMQPSYVLRVSDPDVALVSLEPPYVLQPRKQGQALLLVIDKNRKFGNGESDQPTNERLVMDIPFRVTV